MEFCLILSLQQYDLKPQQTSAACCVIYFSKIQMLNEVKKQKIEVVKSDPQKVVPEGEEWEMVMQY